MTAQEHSGAPTPRKTLMALERTTALALLGIGVIYLFQVLLVWLVRGAVVLPFLIAALLLLLVVSLIVGRRSVAPGLGALVALAPMMTTFTNSLVSSALLHPASNLAFFGILIVQFACALIAGVCGVAAAIQNAL
jgi:hypothetical protein